MKSLRARNVTRYVNKYFDIFGAFGVADFAFLSIICNTIHFRITNE